MSEIASLVWLFSLKILAVKGFKCPFHDNFPCPPVRPAADRPTL